MELASCNRRAALKASTLTPTLTPTLTLILTKVSWQHATAELLSQYKEIIQGNLVKRQMRATFLGAMDSLMRALIVAFVSYKVVRSRSERSVSPRPAPPRASTRLTLALTLALTLNRGSALAHGVPFPRD